MNLENEIIEINDAKDLRNHLSNIFGLNNVANMIGGVVLDNATYNCSAIEAERIGCEDFYEGTLLCDQEEGYIKLNISENEIMNVLWDIFANDSETCMDRNV